MHSHGLSPVPLCARTVSCISDERLVCACREAEGDSGGEAVVTDGRNGVACTAGLQPRREQRAVYAVSQTATEEPWIPEPRLCSILRPTFKMVRQILAEISDVRLSSFWTVGLVKDVHFLFWFAECIMYVSVN